MARGKDESRNENRRPKRMNDWHNMGTVDRRQGYIDALVEKNKDNYAMKVSFADPEDHPLPTESEYLDAYNPETYSDHKNMLPTGRAVTYGRTYQTPSGKWGFEWENRVHPEDHGKETDPLWSNKKGLQGYISALRNMDSVSDAADVYYSSMRRDAAKEHYGDDYNAYRAWEAGEIPEERDEPAPYKAPEGWVAWPSSGNRAPLAISNVEGTRHRLTQEFNTPSAARRAGRKLHKGQNYPYKDHENQTELDLSYPSEVTGFQHL